MTPGRLLPFQKVTSDILLIACRKTDKRKAIAVVSIPFQIARATHILLNAPWE
jgi:hypothetical protein